MKNVPVVRGMAQEVSGLLLAVGDVTFLKCHTGQHHRMLLLICIFLSLRVNL
jgi:hypothetical protein